MANLYIPRSADTDRGSKWDNGKAGAAPVSTPAMGAEIDMASPFEGMKIAGDKEKPDKATQEVCGVTHHGDLGVGNKGKTQERVGLLAHNKAP